MSGKLDKTQLSHHTANTQLSLMGEGHSLILCRESQIRPSFPITQLIPSFLLRGGSFVDFVSGKLDKTQLSHHTPKTQLSLTGRVIR